MCEFCEGLKNGKCIKVETRSTVVGDNICEKINDGQCSECDGCNTYFTIEGCNVQGDVLANMLYYQKIGNKNSYDSDTVIHPYSEAIQFNFCPFCGEQISKNIMKFEGNYKYCIEIEK